MLGYALVDGFARAERSEALASLKQAALDAGGTIVDFAFYEEEAVRLSVELPADALPLLQRALEAEDVQLFEHSLRTISAVGTASSRPLLALLHVALLGASSEDDLARPSRPVPRPPTLAPP